MLVISYFALGLLDEKFDRMEKLFLGNIIQATIIVSVLINLMILIASACIQIRAKKKLKT